MLAKECHASEVVSTAVIGCHTYPRRWRRGSRCESHRPEGPSILFGCTASLRHSSVQKTELFLAALEHQLEGVRATLHHIFLQLDPTQGRFGRACYLCTTVAPRFSLEDDGRMVQASSNYSQMTRLVLILLYPCHILTMNHVCSGRKYKERGRSCVSMFFLLHTLLPEISEDSLNQETLLF